MKNLAKLAKKQIILLEPEPDEIGLLHAQSLFTRIVRAVRRQGYVRAEGNTEACMYRAPDGVRCFIGLAISDKDYSPEIEGSTVQMLHESGRLFSDHKCRPGVPGGASVDSRWRDPRAVGAGIR